VVLVQKDGVLGNLVGIRLLLINKAIGVLPRVDRAGIAVGAVEGPSLRQLFTNLHTHPSSQPLLANFALDLQQSIKHKRHKRLSNTIIVHERSMSICERSTTIRDRHHLLLLLLQ
jgi:hypothetical protein